MGPLYQGKDAGTQYNVLLIVIDALRKDALSIYDGVLRIESLEKLARKGLIFENAYSVTNATDPSLTSMLSGLYPLTHGVIQHGERVSREHLACLGSIEFMQEALRRLGFVTVAIDFLGRWHKRGFDVYVKPMDVSTMLSNLVRRIILSSIKPLFGRIAHKVMIHLRVKEGITFPYNAAQATSLAIKFLKKFLSKKKRFFMLVHYWDTHFPYNAPRELIEEAMSFVNTPFRNLKVRDLKDRIKGEWFELLERHFDNEYLENIVARYYAAIIYVGQQLSRLFEFLEDWGALENTVIIVTSDHGESLGEHDVWFDHHTLYEPSIRVPLIAWVPNGIRGRIRELVQHTDLYPSLLNLMGVKYDASLLDGTSFVTSNGVVSKRVLVYAEEAYTERKFAIRIGSYKLIIAPSVKDAMCRYCKRIHGGIKELYNLDKDPKEERNLIEEEPEIAKEMEKRLRDLLRELKLKNMQLRIRKARGKIYKASN